jgi:hypothetical protein
MGNFWTKSAKWSLLDKKAIDDDWATKRNWICNDQFCPNPYTHARGDPCKLTMEDRVGQREQGQRKQLMFPRKLSVMTLYSFNHRALL